MIEGLAISDVTTLEQLQNIFLICEGKYDDTITKQTLEERTYADSYLVYDDDTKENFMYYHNPENNKHPIITYKEFQEKYDTNYIKPEDMLSDNFKDTFGV